MLDDEVSVSVEEHAEEGRKEGRWGRKENRFREKLLPPLFNAIEFKKSPPQAINFLFSSDKTGPFNVLFSASSISIFIPTYFVYMN